VAIPGSPVKRCPAVLILGVDIGPGLKKTLYDRVVAVLGSPVKRRPAVLILGVDIGPGLKKTVHGVVAVLGSRLKRRRPVVSLIVSIGPGPEKSCTYFFHPKIRHHVKTGFLPATRHEDLYNFNNLNLGPQSRTHNPFSQILSPPPFSRMREREANEE